MNEAANKLRFEHEHHDALQRMQRLHPYYAWTLDLLRPYIGRRVLDAGCGTGHFTTLVAREADFVCAVDLSHENLHTLRQRLGNRSNVEVLRLDLDSDNDLEALAARQLDSVVCLDVLEHVEDDRALLQRVADIVPPGGQLAIKVPACPRLFGSIDRASDHYRRYARGPLVQRVEQAGWIVECCQYMNLAGVGPYWLKSRVLRRRSTFSQTFSPRQLDMISRVVPWIRRLDRLTGPPIGQSLVLGARKPAG